MTPTPSICTSTASQIGASVNALVGTVSGVPGDSGGARAIAWADRSASRGAGALRSDRRGSTTSGRVLEGPNASAAQALLSTRSAIRMLLAAATTARGG